MHAKVQLESSNDLAASYANAKKFIARAGLLSKKEAAEYFGMHPPSRIYDPVTKAKRFDRSQPVEQQQNSSAFAAFAASGGKDKLISSYDSTHPSAMQHVTISIEWYTVHLQACMYALYVLYYVMYVCMYVCLLNTDDINYTIKTLSLCMYVQYL